MGKENESKKNNKIKKQLPDHIATKKIVINKLEMFNNNSFKTTEVLFLIIVTAIVSLIMGYLINGEIENKIYKDSALEEIINNYDYIVENYYTEVDKEKIISGAISGMVNSLDDSYSQLIDQEEDSTFNINLEGSFTGLGVEIYNDNSGNIVVLSALEDSPAEKAGIKSGDIIKKVDDQSLEQKNTTELTNYIKSAGKQKYILLIERNGEEIEIEVNRQLVTIKSVSSKLIEKENKKIGYIYISIFSNSTPEQFKKNIKDLENQNIDALIIDVRENSGGHLKTAVSILSELLDSKHVIYRIEKDGEQTKYYSEGNETKTYPIVVLQNRNSASASELLSSTLKEQYGATVIGETSYGKGTVQEVVSLSNGDTYKFTTKKWLTSKGEWIEEKGVSPDVEISLDEIYQINPTDENDNQLQSAINYIIEESKI